MRQRARDARSLRRANQLLQLRATLVRDLGPAYTRAVAAYVPALRQIAPECGGCTITAAERVLRALGPEGNDIAIKRLVTCAAVELALAS